jgi:hypothetical protein
MLTSWIGSPTAGLILPRNKEKASMLGPWLKLVTDTTLLAMEAQTVIGLRLGQIAMGRGSLAENQLMVTEKMLALAEAAATVTTGGSAHKVVKGYRKKVRANTKRLRRR